MDSSKLVGWRAPLGGRSATLGGRRGNAGRVEGMLSHETSRDRETGRPGDRETGNHPPVVCILINTTTFISPNGTDCQLLIPKRGGRVFARAGACES